MKNHFVSIIGFAFSIIGSTLTVIVLTASTGLIGPGYPEVILFLPFPLVMISAGILTLKHLSYHTDFDQTGITLSFAFRKERIPWECIEWYRNVGFRGKFRGGANIWVWLKYHQPGSPITNCRRALLLLEGAGPAVGWSGKEYKTQLNFFIPDKDKTSI